MDTQLTLVVVVIAVALAFDFLNGFHDAANSIATVVSTRVLSPRAAVLLSSIPQKMAVGAANEAQQREQFGEPYDAADAIQILIGAPFVILVWSAV